MTAAQHLQTLPAWIWLVFTILIIGIITLVYTQGNWRVTLKLVIAAAVIALLIAGLDAWHFYLSSHFIGQFDSLGIPFRKAGPGWSMLLEAWPLWLVPMGVTVALVVAINWLISYLFPQQKKSQVAEPVSSLDLINPVQQVTKRLEIETLKRELSITQDKLAAAIDLSEKQTDKTQDLEIKLEQMQEDQHALIMELEDRISALKLEIATKENQNEELIALNLLQTEEILKLKSSESTSPLP
jgi:hypothetical protein